MIESLKRVLLYSHDTYGLGHIRRTMSVAAALSACRSDVVILTGSPIAGRFNFPLGVDFIRIPGMIKKTNEEYAPLSIRLETDLVVKMRKKLILTTVKTLEPDLFIIDKSPLGMNKEILGALKFIKNHQLKCKTVLGLRDIMDDAASTIATWKRKKIYRVMEQFYDEIWIYGAEKYYNPVKEYRIPEPTSRKVRYLGYLPRKVPAEEEVTRTCKQLRIDPNNKYILAIAGGGGDGAEILINFLAFLEKHGADYHQRPIIVTGPFLPEEQRKIIQQKARTTGAVVIRFTEHLEALMARSDAVVCMGGHNTISELIYNKIPFVVVPRTKPRLEQFIRASAFAKAGICEMIAPEQLNADSIHEKLQLLLKNPEPYRIAMSDVPFTAHEKIRTYGCPACSTSGIPYKQHCRHD